MKKGFTLVELSIVLVIIGLIVGGVLVGRDLIKAAELRSVMTDVEKIQTAVNAFRLKYNCLPGDCSNATTFFGTDSSACPTGGGATGTCDGNNDGQISLCCPNGAEAFRAWQQLGFSGLYSGTFSGIAGSGGVRDATIGTNVPASKIANAGYEFIYLDIPVAVSNRYAAVGNYIFFGAEGVNPYGTQYETHGFVISGGDAFSLDSKYDDGKAATGKTMSIFKGSITYNGLYCTTNDTATADYANLSSSTPSCSLQFKMGF